VPAAGFAAQGQSPQPAQNICELPQAVKKGYDS